MRLIIIISGGLGRCARSLAPTRDALGMHAAIRNMGQHGQFAARAVVAAVVFGCIRVKLAGSFVAFVIDCGLNEFSPKCFFGD